MLVAMPLLLGVSVHRWSNKFDALLITKVNGDLTIAHQYLSRLLENSRDRLRGFGSSVGFSLALQDAPAGGMAIHLEQARQELGLDFLYLLAADGQVIASSPPGFSGPAGQWPVVRAALEGTSAAAIDIFSGADLAALSPDLAERARIDLVPTQAALPTQRTEETRGMMIHAAAPVSGEGGARAALVGGLLLNRNLPFVDTINDLVYRQRSLPEGSQGTATLFLEDVRVSTNVRLFENVRALGTRVSVAVRSTVLDEGRVWLDRAFVVNDWYISAYEPLVDSHGQRVGMLYVGFLETPFRMAKLTTYAGIAVAFLLVAAISVPIFLRWARRIFKPLERMTATIGQVEAGNLGARIGTVQSSDEIARVARHLDSLLDQVQERDRELRAWAEELNRRVDQRTKELRDANRQLEATTQQLVMSEKLAAIGEITAGVAHEINNPIAVIQGNLDVIRDTLGDALRGTEDEFRLIDEQVHRVNVIVTKLLQFARPEEFSGEADRHRPEEVLGDCLLLVQHLLGKGGIAVERAGDTTRLVLISRTELQQVLINLIVNAIHAMPQGGRLILRCRDHGRDGVAGVAIDVRDTGIGISPENLKRVFDPFFTTKRKGGTGLGLSISQSLIRRAGGLIEVESSPGQGTVFTIWLPEAV